MEIHLRVPPGVTADPAQVEGALRAQITGAHLAPAMVGIGFRVRLATGEAVHLTLTSVSSAGTVDKRSRIVLSGDSASPLSPTSPPSAMSVPVTSVSVVPVAIAEGLAGYLTSAEVAVPDPEAARTAEDGLRRLRGVPAFDVAADITTRLRGPDVLRDWAARHHGRADIAALGALRESTSLLLLTGDPGTGKSALMRRIAPTCAGALGEPVMFLQLNERLRGQGIQGRAGSELIGAVATIAATSAEHSLPTVVFLDEADAVASSRGTDDIGSGAQENVAVVDGLIVALDRAARDERARVVFVMATNLLERIDPAVVRRASVYRFTRPDADARRAIVEDLLGDVLDTRSLNRVNKALDRPGRPLTAADITAQVVARAVREAAGTDRPITADRLVELASAAVAGEPVRRS